MVKGWDLAGQGCLLALGFSWVTVPVTSPGKDFGAWGDPGSPAGSSLHKETVIHKHNHSLCTVSGSPAPLQEDGQGTVASPSPIHSPFHPAQFC